MPHQATRATGRILTAALCAGPIFSMTMLAMDLSNGIGAISPLRSGFLWIIPVSIFFGFLLSIIPNLIGASALLAIGDRNEAMRLPVVWGLVGGLLAGWAAFGFGADMPGIVAFSTTGTLCALICRAGTIWD